MFSVAGLYGRGNANFTRKDEFMLTGMNRLLRATVLFFGLVIGLGAQAEDVPHPRDNPKCDPNPVFNRFKGEFLGSCERSRFGDLELKRYKDPAKPKAGYEKFKVEGEHWYYSNDIEKVPGQQPASKLEVLRNFENAVRAAKGTILYLDEGNNRVHFKITRPDGIYWGISGCGGTDGQVCNATHHLIVRVEEMEQSVVVTSEQIAKAMGEEGKVVFYGIYFDTDKATLKAESAPTLVEMGKWLKSNASTKVFIVGHTDMQGSVERNQKLSRDRAAAVIAVMTREYGIKADRMTPDGVGPVAPVATNTTEAGRAKNRRVEMVLR